MTHPQKTILLNLTFYLLFLADWVESRADMTFDHGHGADAVRPRAESLLSTLCDVTMNGMEAEVPRIFSQLVGAVRKLSRSDIRDMYSQLQSGQICRKNNDRTK